MKSITAFLTVFLLASTTAIAESQPDTITQAPSTTAAELPAQKNVIEGKTASGHSQTTIIDVNGNLKVVTPVTSQPEAAPVADQTLPKPVANNDAAPIQP
jgi:hypothetical protein